MEKTSFKFKVNVIESERGWGQRIDEKREFDTYDEAETFLKEVNDQNKEDSVPSIYWRAERVNYAKK